MLEPLQYLAGAGAGALVGCSLGLVGGGGSILAVPMMVYWVGVSNPHVAIGTSALAVAANAATGLANHARAQTVKWRCGGSYAAAGVFGALLGSTVGKAIDGQKLLMLFAVVMLAVGILMLRRRAELGDPLAGFNRQTAPKVLGYGLATGTLSGFFGIGGGFLIVPGLVGATRMPMLNAVGTSLVAVTAFGLATASNYALSGLIDWPLALVFFGGGLVGSHVGTQLARRLSLSAGRLPIVFAVLIFIVAAYMIWRQALILIPGFG
jgi:hypothetical protein